jgi:hypothetical protein
MLKDSEAISWRIARQGGNVGLFRIYSPVYVGEPILQGYVSKSSIRQLRDVRTMTRMFVMDPPGKSMI